MRRSISKATVAALIASLITLGLTGPSSAFGGFHGGFGGFHGGFGGFRPGFGGVHPGFGGMHSGFRPGFVGFHPGFGGRRVFFVHNHRFFRNAVFLNSAVIGGGWWGGWGGYDGCWTYRPVYDGAGNYLGYSYVNICS